MCIRDSLETLAVHSSLVACPSPLPRALWRSSILLDAQSGLYRGRSPKNLADGRQIEMKGYWCHIISPVFFGRSVRARHVSKAEAARRRRQEEADAAASASEAAGPGAVTSPPNAAATSVAGKPGKMELVCLPAFLLPSSSRYSFVPPLHQTISFFT